MQLQCNRELLIWQQNLDLMFPYINHLQKKKIRVLGHYICQAENLLQADVISIGKYEELLLDAFRDDIVFGEESEEGVIID